MAVITEAVDESVLGVLVDAGLETELGVELVLVVAGDCVVTVCACEVLEVESLSCIKDESSMSSVTLFHFENERSPGSWTPSRLAIISFVIGISSQH